MTENQTKVSEITSVLIAHYDNRPFWIPAGTNCRDITGRLTMQTCLGSPENPII